LKQSGGNLPLPPKPNKRYDPTDDLTPHQANTGNPLYGSSVPDDDWVSG
jgi:hypothetical protein